MSIRTHLENYRTLRQAPMWKLLASDTGPLSIALLQTLLYDNERVLPASLFSSDLLRAMLKALRSRSPATKPARSRAAGSPTAISSADCPQAPKKKRTNSPPPDLMPFGFSRAFRRAAWVPRKAASK